MKTRIDLSALAWTLRGFTPCSWRWGYAMETGAALKPEVGPLPAAVPGSVQAALLAAGVIEDWNLGMNARACEWVENRDWIFSADMPAAAVPEGARCEMLFEGLDGNGAILINGVEAGRFDNAFIPYRIDATPHLRPGEPTRLEIAFEPPPRWLGQFGRTSEFTSWKPRFNYTWDWTSRLVQIGVWDRATAEISQGPRLLSWSCPCEVDVRARSGGVKLTCTLQGADACAVRLVLKDPDGLIVAQACASAADCAAHGLRLDLASVRLWWPNGMGEQPLYVLEIEVVGPGGQVEDRDRRTIGFRHVDWRACEGAPPGADPWLCVVNDMPVFLFGVNWTPVRPNFADVSAAEVDRRLDVYQDIGCNLMRVWGGATLEKESFYASCDRRGLMVWQEFPLSSSGIENWPPEDQASVDALTQVAASYIERRAHHPSLILWCGGNELQGALDGGKTGCGKPVDLSHPLIGRFNELVRRLDPLRRFLPSSSSGPRFCADEKDFGKGLHWDVHGPWSVVEDSMSAQRRYWGGDDALFRSEAGCPGASPAALIRRYAGLLGPTPVSLDNPLWRRSAWWFDWPQFVEETGCAPDALEAYVAWSQSRQAEALGIAAAAAVQRFPRCGGFIVWMGHDSFPCFSNTAIIDFEGFPKPAAHALAQAIKAGRGQ